MQFEKILGLEPGSSVINDTTNKVSNNRKTTADVGSSRDGSSSDKDATVYQAGLKPDVESADGDGGGVEPGGKKKPRRSKKRGKGGGNEQPRGSKDGSAANSSGPR